MADWTPIPDVDVEPGGIPKGSTITALRDNVTALAQRSAGAPVIVGAIYDYQEFTASGTWTKPANAQAGDRVIVHVVGGGGAGGRNTDEGITGGGGGGGGILHKFNDIAALSATVPVTVGSGAAGRSTNGLGATGGASSFGTSGANNFIQCLGGAGGLQSSAAQGDGTTQGGGGTASIRVAGRQLFYGFRNRTQRLNFARFIPSCDGGCGGAGGGDARDGSGSIYGGGGGGAGGFITYDGGASMLAGAGGRGSPGSTPQDGQFPGGGGGGSGDGTSGAGANGVVRVWAIRDA